MNDKLQQATSGTLRTGVGGWLGGRARRREYWVWMAPLFIVMLLLAATGLPGVTLLPGVPMLLAMIRRLHDLGRSGWFALLINVGTNVAAFGLTAALGDVGALLGLLVYVGALGLLGAWPGQPGSNAYGQPPGKMGKIAETFA